jgi:hypothetical protein
MTTTMSMKLHERLALLVQADEAMEKSGFVML